MRPGKKFRRLLRLHAGRSSHLWRLRVEGLGTSEKRLWQKGQRFRPGFRVRDVSRTSAGTSTQQRDYDTQCVICLCIICTRSNWSSRHRAKPKSDGYFKSNTLPPSLWSGQLGKSASSHDDTDLYENSMPQLHSVSTARTPSPLRRLPKGLSSIPGSQTGPSLHVRQLDSALL